MSGANLESGVLLVDKPSSLDEELATSASLEESSRALGIQGGEAKASRSKLRQATVLALSGLLAVLALGAVAWQVAQAPAARDEPSVGTARQQVLYAEDADACGKADQGVDYIFEGDWLLLVGSVSASERCCHLCNARPECRAWTWISNATQVEGTDPGQCWLKGGTLIQKLPKPGLISALSSGSVQTQEADAAEKDEQP